MTQSGSCFSPRKTGLQIAESLSKGTCTCLKSTPKSIEVLGKPSENNTLDIGSTVDKKGLQTVVAYDI